MLAQVVKAQMKRKAPLRGLENQLCQTNLFDPRLEVVGECDVLEPVRQRDLQDVRFCDALS